MKKLIWILLLVILVGIGFQNRQIVAAQANDVLYQSPCKTPKTYRIGTIDQRFAISESELTAAIQEAANIWNTAYGKSLFVYETKAPFTINLIYDTRQTLNNQISQLNDDLTQKDTALKPEIAAYQRKSADLQARINQLNQEIESWNQKGGAPADVYDKLKAQQTQLRKEGNELNATAESLSLATQQYNGSVQELDQKVDIYNEALHYKPEGGVYIYDQQGERIEIYIYASRQELIHTLAHEIGHALRIEHVNNPQAIMFSKTNNALSPSTDDLSGLTVACQKRNIIKAKITNLSYIIQQSLEKIKNINTTSSLNTNQ